MKKKAFSWEIFAICLFISYSAAFLDSLFVYKSVKSGGYASLKPDLAPSFLASIVILIFIFFLIACSIYLVWTIASKHDKIQIAWWFLVNLVLNVLWSILYFGMHNPFFAFIELVLLWLSTLFLMLGVWTIERRAGYILVPYLLLVTFIAVLNLQSL